MISIFSKKDIAIDLDKFESGELNKLLIIGESGAGKTVASKYFAEKFSVPYYSTDEFFWANRELRKKDVAEYRKKRDKFEADLINNPERSVIEGAGIHRMPEEVVMNLPVIILGKSGFIGAIHAGLRNKRLGKATGKFLPEFKVAFIKNFTELSRKVSDFRKKRLKVSNSLVRDIKIPRM